VQGKGRRTVTSGRPFGILDQSLLTFGGFV